MSLLQQIAQAFSSEADEDSNGKNTENPRTPDESTRQEEHHSAEDRDDASSVKGEVPNNNSDAMSTTKDTQIEVLDNNKIEITNLPQGLLQANEEAEEKSKRKKVGASADDESQSSVSFGSIHVREYERVIDSTQMYMGLALGWSYNDNVPTPVREKNKTAKYAAGAHGGEEKMKRTNGSDRYGMLIRYGYAHKELKQASKEAAKFYKQRSREAARPLVVAEANRNQEKNGKPKRRLMLRSMFG